MRPTPIRPAGAGGADVLFQLGRIEAADRVAVDARLAQAELQGELQQIDSVVAAPLPALAGRPEVRLVLCNRRA